MLVLTSKVDEPVADVYEHKSAAPRAVGSGTS